jgi:lipocalin
MGVLFSGPPKTADHVSIETYTGFNTVAGQRQWYCPWALPAIYMPTSDYDVPALYKWNPAEQHIELTNTSMNHLGELKTIKGRAWLDPNYDQRAKSKLLVEFNFSEYVGTSLPLYLPPAHYWILMVAPDQNYRYAVVSSPCRTSLFILSSEPTLSTEDFFEIRERLYVEFGFSKTTLARLHSYYRPPASELTEAEAELRAVADI